MKNLNRRELVVVATLALSGVMIQIPLPVLAAENIDLSVYPLEIGKAFIVASGVSDIKKLRSTIPQTRTSLIRQIHNDYQAGKTFRFQGWVLSHTEGRVCAISFLSRPMAELER